MQLKVIDFNARFMQDYMQWCQEQEGQEEAQEQSPRMDEMTL